MAEQYKKGQSGFLKNLVNKLPYQSLDFNKVLGDLNPKYNTFEDTGMRRVEALAKNSIFYNNDLIILVQVKLQLTVIIMH